MARIIVVGGPQGIVGQDARERIIDQLRHDGHDGAAGDGLNGVDDADALIFIADGADAPAGGSAGFALARGKPVLALAGADDAWLTGATTVAGAGFDDWLAALPSFYEAVRPFAGRVVRDRIPELVKEAGHDVRFREVGDDERPRFLKQKVANEARELLESDVAGEKEEVADVLEAMEAFIQSRKFDRDDLKRIKDAKRKRRGGFARVFVVESTNT